MLRKHALYAQMTALAVGLLVACPSLQSNALAFGSSSSTEDEGSLFTKAVKAVKAKSFDKAIGLLQKVLKDDPKNADALNYLAYSQRSIGKLDDAMANYNAALAINPNHLGALEYQGELFLMLHDKAGAEANLARLNALCDQGCPEQRAMQDAMNEFNKSKTSANFETRMGY